MVIRKYAAPTPVQASAAIFAAPPRLVLQIDGRPVELTGTVELIETNPEYALWRWQGRAGDVPVSAETRLEFDGFVTVDLDLQTRGIRVDQLLVEFPLRRQDAGFYTLGPFYNEHRSGDASALRKLRRGVNSQGAVGDGFTIGFNHAVWIGSEHRGMQWVTETAEFWRNADRARAIEVVPQDEQTVLRLRVIDRPTEVDRLTYRWGMAVSPVRPYLGERSRPTMLQHGGGIVRGEKTRKDYEDVIERDQGLRHRVAQRVRTLELRILGPAVPARERRRADAAQHADPA